VRFCAASDQSLLVHLGEEIGLPVHRRVLALLRLLQKKRPSWLRNVQPAYTSVMLTFDLCQADHAEVEAVVRRYAKRARTLRLPKARTRVIPVCYGGEFGPDLESVAAIHGLKSSEVIQLHSSRTYYAYFLGFAPGFAYLGDVPPQIVTPRLDTPRKAVPPGSVGIAGKQTGVYPFTTPGGWRLIGRTPLPMFRANRQPIGLISIGDQVEFRPISREEFHKRESG
jgi:inhibitor of KinA